MYLTEELALMINHYYYGIHKEMKNGRRSF